jgi:hypothetical protein
MPEKSTWRNVYPKSGQYLLRGKLLPQAGHIIFLCGYVRLLLGDLLASSDRASTLALAEGPAFTMAAGRSFMLRACSVSMAVRTFSSMMARGKAGISKREYCKQQNNQNARPQSHFRTPP